MRYFVVFQLFMMVFLLPLSGSAASFGEFTDYVWGPPKSDFVRPHLEEAKIPHNSQWADDEWSPQDWIDSRGGNPSAVIEGFYTAGIVADQYFDEDIPVLEVGQQFLDLSDRDKGRVIAFMDEVFGVTKSSSAERPGVIMIYFKNENTPVGLFTAQGLQLQ